MKDVANAIAPAPMGGEPMDPEGLVPAELLPTPADDAATALGAWIFSARDASSRAGGVAINRDRKSVIVYWKGTPPAGLQELADSQPVPVTIRAAAYSLAELDPISKKLMTDNGDVLTSVGPSHDYSGVSVTVKSTAPSDTLAKLQSQTSVPVIVDGIADAVDLTGNATATSDQ